MGAITVPGRTYDALGSGDRPHGGLRIQGRLARRLWNELGRYLRRHEALLRSSGELYRRERSDGRNAAISRRRIPSADALELRGGNLHRRIEELGLALDTPAARTVDARAQQTAPLP